MSRKIKKILAKVFESGNIIIIISAVALLPFLVISIFNNPSADDFCYSNYTRDLGYLNLQREAYVNWTGRYFSTAIMGISALVSGAFFIYKLFPVLLLLLLFLSAYHLCTSVFASLSIKDRYVISCFLITLYILQMPSVAQGLYWLAGSVTYQLSVILSMLFFSFVIRYLNTLNRKYLTISILLSVLLVGSNEIALMFVNLIIGFAFLNSLVNSRKVNYAVLMLLIVMAIFSAIVVFSPGSAARATTYPGNQQFLYSFLKTIKATKRHVGDWLPTLIISLFVFFDFFKNIQSVKKTPKVFEVKLFFPTIIVFSFLVLGVFPVYYSLKWVPLRTVNFIYFFFLLGIVYLSFVLFFKLRSKNKNFISISKWARAFLLIIVFIRLVSENNIKTAYFDLLSGKAYAYDKELKTRYAVIKNNDSKILVVPELNNKPKTIFFEEIKSDPRHWINQCYGAYFGKKEIKLKSKAE